MTMRKVLPTALAIVLFAASVAQAGGWHGYPHYQHHHHNNGLGIALGITGAVLGTAILVDAFSRPRYVAPAPSYYYPPPVYSYPAPPQYYQTPPSAYPPAPDAYEQGYQAGLAEARRYEEGRRRAVEENVDYGLGSLPLYRRR